MSSSSYRITLSALLVAGAAVMAAAPAASGAAATPAVRPMYRQAESGWLEREVYRWPAGGEAAVQFLDVLVGPGRHALVRGMPTGALLDVQGGFAVVTVDRMRKRSAPGIVIPIDQGQDLSIDNRAGERAFVARLIRIASPR